MAQDGKSGPSPSGEQGVTEADRGYRGSRYAEVRDALLANPYQPVWGAPDAPPSPRHEVTLRGIYAGVLKGGRADHLTQAAARTLDTRADLRWGEDRRGVRRLIHPNGVCLFGRWEISEDSGYSGCFRAGSRGLVIARASVGRSVTTRGHVRSFSIVSKLYPTFDSDHAEPLQPANIFMQDTITGTGALRITDVELTNAPSVRLLDDVADIPITVRIGTVLRKADEMSGIRQLYPVAELGLAPGEPTQAPDFMRLTPAPGHRVIDEDDFRDEVLGHIFDKGDPRPQRTLAFDIAVTDRGTKVGNPLTGEHHAFSGWRTIGRITFDNAVASYNGDFVLHFHHPPWRRDKNDPRSVARVDGKLRR